jgi:hypothetical protein
VDGDVELRVGSFVELGRIEPKRDVEREAFGMCG